MQINPLDPVYLKGFNAGRKLGRKDAVDHFEARLMTLEQVPGIGIKTAVKVKEYFEGVEKE
ncbi:hypothetical protein [Bacillus sp. FSL K6-3431]|uniref:hypothetical protein n=1 Tax=Bacillus sp. FSL K6-3431 TaxID=2921500 RepID=UPI0030F6C5CD